MFKRRKREHSEEPDGKDDGGDVSEGLRERRKALNKMMLEIWFPKVIRPPNPSILQSILNDPKIWQVQYANQPNPKSMGIHMSLLDSETGKTVKKLTRRFRPTVKSTKPIPGWRVWGCTKSNEGSILESISANYLWLGPVATTKKGNDGQPMRVMVENPIQVVSIKTVHLDYGIYSYKTPKLLHRYHGFGAGNIIGRLDNYGHVVEHDYGYRSQKVIIRELWILAHANFVDDVPIKELALRYDCPVHFLDTTKLTPWIDYHTEEATDG